jgi:hypothetical protein
MSPNFAVTQSPWKGDDSLAKKAMTIMQTMKFEPRLLFFMILPSMILPLPSAPAPFGSFVTPQIPINFNVTGNLR